MASMTSMPAAFSQFPPSASNSVTCGSVSPSMLLPKCPESRSLIVCQYSDGGRGVDWSTSKQRRFDSLKFKGDDGNRLTRGKIKAVAGQLEEIAVEGKPARRVVVTGMSVLTPIGTEVDEFYENLLNGVSGVREIETFDSSRYITRIAAEVKPFPASRWVQEKLLKRTDRYIVFAIAAGKKALEHGGLSEEVMAKIDKSRCGILIGSSMGGIKNNIEALRALRISFKKLSPFAVPFSSTHMGSALLAMDLGWMGPNYASPTSGATGSFCIMNAANHIFDDETDMMLCGAADAALYPPVLAGMVASKVLSQRNLDPTKASRPWDKNRDGMVLGEGAAVLLLEELEHAKRRGATIYAEFLGGSFSCDAYHMTRPRPNGKGFFHSMEKALAQSRVAREDINLISAHAPSTVADDTAELIALNQCFGEIPGVKINSTKSMIGYLMGASSGVDAVAAVKAIQTGWIHPNINLEDPEEGVDMKMLVGNQKEQLDIKVAMTNSFGFGGHYSSILFRKFE